MPASTKDRLHGTRKARVYRLTPRGRRQLTAETERFAQFVAAVSPILLPT